MATALPTESDPLPPGSWWTTMNGWRDHANRAPAVAPALSRSDFDNLSADQRRSYSQARRRPHLRPTIATPAVTQAIARGRKLLVANRQQPAAGRQHLAICGPAGTGASRVALELARSFYTVEFARQPVSNHGDLPNRHPVAYLTAPPEGDVAALVRRLFTFFYETNWDPTHRSWQELTTPLATLLPRAMTRLVVVDEAERIAPTAAACAQALTDLSVLLPVTFAFVHRTTAAGDTELANPSVLVQPLPRGPQWHRIVAVLDAQLRLLDHTPGTLTDLEQGLHDLTGGRVGTLCRIIGAAETQAVDTSERLTLEQIQDAATHANVQADL